MRRRKVRRRGEDWMRKRVRAKEVLMAAMEQAHSGWAIVAYLKASWASARVKA